MFGKKSRVKFVIALVVLLMQYSCTKDYSTLLNEATTPSEQEKLIKENKVQSLQTFVVDTVKKDTILMTEKIFDKLGRLVKEITFDTSNASNSPKFVTKMTYVAETYRILKEETKQIKNGKERFYAAIDYKYNQFAQLVQEVYMNKSKVQFKKIAYKYNPKNQLEHELEYDKTDKLKEQRINRYNSDSLLLKTKVEQNNKKAQTFNYGYNDKKWLMEKVIQEENNYVILIERNKYSKSGQLIQKEIEEFKPIVNKKKELLSRETKKHIFIKYKYNKNASVIEKIVENDKKKLSEKWRYKYLNGVLLIQEDFYTEKEKIARTFITKYKFFK